MSEVINNIVVELKRDSPEIKTDFSIGAKGDQGIQGPKGDQGIQGIQGIKGDKGDVGPQGLKGDKGDKGDQGIQGIQGIKGDKGDQGDIGPQGPVGATGPQGPQGEQGYRGEVGPQGTQGPIGLTGPQGDMGPRGFQGLKGDKGATGAQGPIGPEGPQGPVGPTGAQGVQGEQGPQGIQGPIGPEGPQGVQGPKGDTGDKGERGFQGVQGEIGPQGIQGIQGPKGDQGPRGQGVINRAAWQSGSSYYNNFDEISMVYTEGNSYYCLQTHVADISNQPPNGTFWSVAAARGPQGPQGIQGIQGPKGDTGFTGPQGEKGDKGAPGLPGAKGDPGVQGEVGPKGDQGIQGIQGIQGEVGPKGDKGDKGDQGPSGSVLPDIVNLMGDRGDITINAAAYMSTGKYGLMNIDIGNMVKDVDGYKCIDLYYSDLDWPTYPRCTFIRFTPVAGHRYILMGSYKGKGNVRQIDIVTGAKTKEILYDNTAFSRVCIVVTAASTDIAFRLMGGYVTADKGFVKDIMLIDTTVLNDDALSDEAVQAKYAVLPFFNGSFAVSGIQGPQGPEGPRGLQGIQGEPGPKGDKGDPGVGGDPATIFNRPMLYPTLADALRAGYLNKSILFIGDTYMEGTDNWPILVNNRLRNLYVDAVDCGRLTVNKLTVQDFYNKVVAMGTTDIDLQIFVLGLGMTDCRTDVEFRAWKVKHTLFRALYLLSVYKPFSKVIPCSANTLAANSITEACFQPPNIFVPRLEKLYDDFRSIYAYFGVLQGMGASEKIDTTADYQRYLPAGHREMVNKFFQMLAAPIERDARYNPNLLLGLPYTVTGGNMSGSFADTGQCTKGDFAKQGAPSYSMGNQFGFSMYENGGSGATITVTVTLDLLAMRGIWALGCISGFPNSNYSADKIEIYSDTRLLYTISPATEGAGIDGAALGWWNFVRLSTTIETLKLVYTKTFGGTGDWLFIGEIVALEGSSIYFNEV